MKQDSGAGIRLIMIQAMEDAAKSIKEQYPSWHYQWTVAQFGCGEVLQATFSASAVQGKLANPVQP